MNILIKTIITIAISLSFQTTFAQKTKVAVFIYQGVELLDFAAPLEVFSNTTDFEVFTVAPNNEPILAMNKNIKFIPNYSIENCPKPDILVLPGANIEGLMPVYNDTKVIDWIKNVHETSTITMSVCTGAALLSKAGILDGRTATSHWGAIKNLQNMTPKANIIANKRFVEDGRILTTAGVSAGLDGALYVVEKLKGKAEATIVANNIEYDKYEPSSGYIVGSESINTKKRITQKPKNVNQKSQKVAKANSIIKEEITKDLLCGMKVGKNQKINATYKNVKYNFCSNSCKERFLTSPEKFVVK
jgi:transcriptional regulator GlxA family with amidase domain